MIVKRKVHVLRGTCTNKKEEIKLNQSTKCSGKIHTFRALSPSSVDQHQVQVDRLVNMASFFAHVLYCASLETFEDR